MESPKELQFFVHCEHLIVIGQSAVQLGNRKLSLVRLYLGGDSLLFNFTSMRGTRLKAHESMTVAFLFNRDG